MDGLKISFIVSTHRARDMVRLRSNLRSTVRNAHEIIAIENHGRYSLTEAYNLGARQAQGEFLCFVHEDALFCDDQWDERVLNRFAERPDLGLVGVAGCRRRPDLPIGFFTRLPGDTIMTIRGLQAGGEMMEQRCKLPPDECQVRVLDGVFLFTRRKVWAELPFDENVKGFHFYDVDFSFRVSHHYRVEVIPNLMIEHISSVPRVVPTGQRTYYEGGWAKAAIAYRPNREGLVFDRLSPAETMSVKRFWLEYLCVDNCAFRLRWRYQRALELPLSAFYYGLPILSPRLFRFSKARWQKLRLRRQERFYASQSKCSGDS